MDTREGSLGREVQASIGSHLRREYQKIIDEGVPDRFVELLQRYEKKVEEGPTESKERPRPVDHESKDPSHEP